MNWQLFAVFMIITGLLTVTPGPIVTLLVATGATRGVRAGLTTAAGTAVGNALLLAAIGLGLDWILRHATVIFEILRWGGAAYLVWLGIQAWRNAGNETADPAPERVNFLRGVGVGLANPKTIAFFATFLPQFVDPRLPAQPQLAAMCAAAVVIATATQSGWAMAAGLGRAWLMQPPRARLLGRLSAVALIGGGVWLSLVRRPA